MSKFKFWMGDRISAATKYEGNLYYDDYEEKLYVCKDNRFVCLTPDAYTCLIEGTQISMADGSTKAVEELCSGELLLSYDPVTKQNVPAVLVAAYKTGMNEGFSTYNFSNGSYLKIFGTHGFYNLRTGDTADIKTIKTADRLLTQSGEEVQWIGTIGCASREKKPRRYNILSSNNLYYANGILLGAKPYQKLNYARRVFMPLSDELQALWEQEAAEYDKYHAIETNPEYRAEVKDAYHALTGAYRTIRQNKQKLTASDYKTQKYTEGVLGEEEWSAAKTERAAWRKEINDSEAVASENSRVVKEIRDKYRGGATPRSLFEDCCTRDNAAFETAKAYFAELGWGKKPSAKEDKA